MSSKALVILNVSSLKLGLVGPLQEAEQSKVNQYSTSNIHLVLFQKVLPFVSSPIQVGGQGRLLGFLTSTLVKVPSGYSM